MDVLLGFYLKRDFPRICSKRSRSRSRSRWGADCAAQAVGQLIAASESTDGLVACAGLAGERSVLVATGKATLTIGQGAPIET